MMKTPPKYTIPPGTRCPSCGRFCMIIPLRNEFDYAATHCTHGKDGTHYPDNWGDPVSDCCETPFLEENYLIEQIKEKQNGK